MASTASPSAADPEMADLCNHTAHASSSNGFAEDGYFKRPIQPNIYGETADCEGQTMYVMYIMCVSIVVR